MDQFIKCDNSHVSFQELLNSVVVKETATGLVGLRTVETTIAHAGLEDFIQCDSAFLLTPEEIFRRLVVIDTASNKPAILLIHAS